MATHMTFPLRNIAAKWIRLGRKLFSVRALTHEALPGVIIQPVQIDSESPPLNVIVIDDSTDILLTFESHEAAESLCKAIMLAVSYGPQRPAGTFGITSGMDPTAEGIIRAIEKATLAARVAGTLSHDQGSARRAHDEALRLENEAIKAVLKAFNSLPPDDAPG